MCPAALAQVSVSPSTLDNGTVGVEYSQTFSAEGGSGYYAWGCEGTLPEGLSFNADTATLSGTPTVEASCSFTIQVLSFGESTWTPFSYDLNIYSPPPPPPLAISGSLTGGVTGGEYSQTLFASGGAGNYSWWIAAGSLPAELSLDFYTGMISGTPVSSGTSFFTVTVVDGDWNSVSADYQITVYDPPAISGSLPNGMANVAYSQTLGVEGGSGSYSWALSGQPCGLDVDAGGTVSGTPSTPGTYYFTVTVTDLESGGSAQAVYEITVGSAPIAVSNVSATAGSSDAVVYLTMTMPYGGDSFCADVYMGGVWYGSGSPDENGSVAVSISGLEPNTSYSFEIQASGNIPGFGGCSVWDGAGGFQTGADSVLEFSAATYQANENDGSVTITINRSGSCAAAVSVDYSGDGEGTVAFEPWETGKTFTIPITDDDVFTGDATFTLVLSNPQGGAAVGSQSVAVLTIIETDSPPSPPEVPPPPEDPTPSVSMWDLRVDALSETTATISWAASAEVPSGSWWYDSGTGSWQGSWSSTSTVPDNNTVNYSGEGGSGSVAGTYDWGSGRVVATITDLAPGYSYGFTAVSSSGDVSASADGSFFVGTPNLTLANVTANSINCDYASVSWEVSWPCGEFHYALYSSADGSSYSMAAAGSDGTSAMLYGLQPNQTYYYCVLVDAYDSNLNYYSASSEVQSFTTPAAIHISSAPTVGEVDGDSVQVSWTVENGSGQTATHRVSVLALDGTEVASGEMESGDSAVSIQVDGLVPGYNYRYIVTSKINDDPGWFETVGGEGEPLTFVIALTISDVGVNWDYTSLVGDTLHVCLNWTVQPAGATSSHTVFRDADTWVTACTEAGDGSGLVTAFFDLNPGDRWPVWVQSGGTIANKDNPIIVEGLPLVTITNLLAEPLTPTTALVSWNADSHGAAISNVVSYWSGSNPINTVTADFSGGVVIATLTNLAANTAYDFFVLSDSGSNATTTVGAFATIYSNFVSKAYVCITNAPTRGVVDVATRSTTLNWGIENNSGQNIHNTVTYTWVAGTASGNGTAISGTAFGESIATVTVSNLVAGATYTFNASSFVVGHDGEAAYSSSIPESTFTVTTLELPPVVSSIITISNVVTEFASDTAALISWNVAKTNVTDWAYHYVAYSTNSALTATNTLIAEGFEFVDTPSQVMAILEGLTPSTNYSFFVQSVIDGTPGHYATADNQASGYTFTTGDPVEAPVVAPDNALFITITNAPTSLVTDTMALITWGVSNAFPVPGTHYVIWKNAVPTATIHNVNNMVIASGLDDGQGTAAVLLTGLAPGSTNYYFVQSSVELGGEFFYATTNNAGLNYWFVTNPGDPSDSGAGGGGTDTGTSGSGSGSGSADGSSSGSSSGGSSGTSGGNGSGNGDSSSQTTTSGGANSSTADASAQTVKATVSFSVSAMCAADEPSYGGATLTLSGPGMEATTKELGAYSRDVSFETPTGEDGQTETVTWHEIAYSGSVVWDVDLIPGEKYTLTLDWKKPSIGNFGAGCGLDASVNVSSDYFIWPPSNMAKTGSWQTYDTGQVIEYPPNGTSYSWTITAPKIEIAVDANRDGDISFGAADKTSETNPFRFWVNNDRDVPYTWDPNYGVEPDFIDEASAVTGSDSDSHIGTKRNLEDYFKIAVSIKGMDGPIGNEGVNFWLWSEPLDVWNEEETLPVFTFYHSCENNGGTGYLSNDQVADTQVNGVDWIGSDGPHKYGQALTCEFPAQTIRKEYFDDLLSAGSKKYFLVQAGCPGRGKLSFSISGDGVTKASLYVDMKDIKQMYQRKGYINSNNSIDHRADNPNVTVTLDPWQPDTITFDRPPDETNECVVFVHGWDMPDDYVFSYGETLYKRLWWQGYRGRFVIFRWPCLIGKVSVEADGATFNPSELRAWRCGGYLKSCVDALRAQGFGAISVIAHSQGNVVAGEALRQGIQINNYIALEAALPAGCYDESLAINSYDRFYTLERRSPTPGNADWGYVGYLKNVLANVPGNKVNFYNTQDYATAKWWETNQDWQKPAGNGGSSYFFFPLRFPPDFPDGLSRYRTMKWWDAIFFGLFTYQEHYVRDTDESRAMVARSRSKALGATADAVGDFGREPLTYNGGTPFTKDEGDHSGQFKRRIQQVWDLYEKLSTYLK